MISSADAAREVAITYLREEVQPGVGEELVTGDVREYKEYWAVDYNTRIYIETGAISHALAGGGPVIVERFSGTARLADCDPIEDTPIDRSGSSSS
jgi:hypothetical protein